MVIQHNTFTLQFPVCKCHTLAFRSHLKLKILNPLWVNWSSREECSVRFFLSNTNSWSIWCNAFYKRSSTSMITTLYHYTIYSLITLHHFFFRLPFFLPSSILFHSISQFTKIRFYLQSSVQVVLNSDIIFYWRDGMEANQPLLCTKFLSKSL